MHTISARPEFATVYGGPAFTSSPPSTIPPSRFAISELHNMTNSGRMNTTYTNARSR